MDGRMVDLKTGEVSSEQARMVLDALPVEVTFVDEQDIIRYYNDPPTRIFAREKEILGTTVQSCHPAKSVAAVNQVLDELKSGRKDEVRFSTPHQGKTVIVRYRALRDPTGAYKGCLEVAYDAAIETASAG